MRWIRTNNGDKAHAVTNNAARTLCGIRVLHAGAIVTPEHYADRCANCDHEWEKRGRRNQRKPKPTSAVYEPVFTFRDWEDV
jgi:hypothetical protein